MQTEVRRSKVRQIMFVKALRYILQQLNQEYKGIRVAQVLIAYSPP